MAEQLSRLQPLAKAGGYGLKQLQPMQSPHWNREKSDEEGVAKRSCQGQTPNIISYARVVQGEGKVENLRGKGVTVDIDSAWECGARGQAKGVFLMSLFSPPFC